MGSLWCSQGWTCTGMCEPRLHICAGVAHTYLCTFILDCTKGYPCVIYVCMICMNDMYGWYVLHVCMFIIVSTKGCLCVIYVNSFALYMYGWYVLHACTFIIVSTNVIYIYIYIYIDDIYYMHARLSLSAPTFCAHPAWTSNFSLDAYHKRRILIPKLTLNSPKLALN